MEYIEEIYDQLLLIYQVQFQLIDHDLILLLLPYLDPFAKVHENIQLNEEYQLIDPTNNFSLQINLYFNIKISIFRNSRMRDVQSRILRT